MNSGISDKSFTQQWLQSLTLAARDPAAQRIKPMIENINELGRQHAEGDRMESARRLWDFATSEGLLNMLAIMPLTQPIWVFDRDDNFAYTRATPSSGNPGQASGSSTLDFDTWTGWLGIQPCSVPLVAEVNSRDWLSLLRQEAVRLQQSLSTTAVPAGLTLHLPCKAEWDLVKWSVRFDEAQWMVLNYEEGFSVQRPELSEIEETLMWSIAQANDVLLPKTTPKCQVEVGGMQPWIDCVPRLKELHQRVLVTDIKHYAPWFRRVWSCVWTVIYREQNVLRGQANIDNVRQEIAASIKDVPRLTMWMFIFAKLVCETQLGRGLGVSGDYLA